MNLLLFKKVNKVFFFFCAGFIAIFLLSFFLPGYFSSSDIFNNLPSFNNGEFTRPKNSLLSDPIVQFEPWREYAKKEFKEGRLPLWNTLNSFGSPFLANPQTAIFFPLTLVYYFLSAQVGLYMIHFVKLFFMFLFSYLYLRSLKLAKISSVLGSVSIVSSGFFVVWLQWPHTNVFLFFPLILFITERIILSKRRHNWYALLSISYLFATTGGHPETLFHIILIHVGYTYFRIHKKTEIFPVFISLLTGLLLGSFLIFPFLEYLLKSETLPVRIGNNNNVFLPLLSLVQYVFPFAFGAPHQEYYRPILASTNFQETIGGYVGLIVLGTGIYGTWKFWNRSLVKFWSVLAISIFFLSYGIWPIALLSKLPIFSLSNNIRLIGFIGFSLSILSAFVFESLLISKKPFLFNKNKKIVIFTNIIFFLSVAFILFLSKISFSQFQSFPLFVPFLQRHLLLILFSTLIYLFLVCWIKGKKQKLLWLLLLVPLLAQTAYLFFTYNPIISKNYFYPENSLIKKIQQLPPGNILEVGNMYLPEDSNMMYGLSSVQNYDAIQVKQYQDSFMHAFPVLSRWGKPEAVTYASLAKFGIAYVIADYDIRYKLQIVQPGQSQVLSPLSGSNSYLLRFNKDDKPKAVRLLFATYNRHNPCLIQFSLINIDTKYEEVIKKIKCDDVSNFMYYTVEIPRKDTINSYFLKVQGIQTGDRNFVSLVGQGKNPYVAIVTNKKTDLYGKLTSEYKRKNLELFSLKNLGLLSLPVGNYLTVSNNPLVKQFVTHSISPVLITSYMTDYPGWRVSIDGEVTSLSKNGPFIQFFLPQGDHFVQIFYVPISFYLGCFVSLLTLFILCVYLVRNERKHPRYKSLQSLWVRLAYKANKTVWYKHILYLLVGYLISIFSYVFIVMIFHKSFVVPSTTAINWFTIHHYPRQQDYYYFYFAVIYITVLSIFIWGSILWRKIEK